MNEKLSELIYSDSAAVMGVINCTPDSFYPESRKDTIFSAAEKARVMIREGADILDIGGESTRPGAAYVDVKEEIARVVPVIEKIREFSLIPISVDTRKCETAAAALDAGADMLNDVSAMEDDPDIASLAAELNVPVVLMHKKGTPETMQQGPFYKDAVEEIKTYLAARADDARSRGIGRENIILDPGIGFGKRLEDNTALLRSLKSLLELGFPVLIGASRKSFIGTVLGEPGTPLPVEDRLIGTVAVHMWSLLQGAAILRVHDVKAHVEMRKIVQTLQKGGD